MQKNGIYSLFFFIVLSVGMSCGEKSIFKSRKKSSELSYFPTFEKLPTAEARQMQRDAHSFYIDVLGKDQFNGQFLVAKKGKVVYLKAQGFSNFSKKEEMTYETPVHVASVSKVVTAFTVLRLVDQGRIKLDSDIRSYLREIPYKGITVRMLLNHRSGIPYYGYFTFHTWHLGTILRNYDIVRLLKKHKFPLNFPPDSKFAYCNTNYALLALIVEKATGKPFPKAVKELVLNPLKMKHTFVMDRSKQLSAVSQSYNSRHILQNFDYLDAIYGDKNLYTTAVDLFQLDKASYSVNFLSDSLRSQMFKGYSYERPGKSNYGLGIRLKELEGKDTYFFHSGWWHGNTACYVTLRDDSTCIIALSNVYTKSVYNVNRLAAKYGNYPFSFDEE
jgi:CubicO group peptidase (beta-lactamase class C family)